MLYNNIDKENRGAAITNFRFLSNNRGTLFSSKIITYFLHKKEGYFSVFYVMKKYIEK